VLVHCRGGMNRSATMVAAFLVWKFPGMTAAEAMAVVRQARPAARFGRGEEGVLQRDLRQWELDCAVARESWEQDGQGCVDGEAEKEPAPTGES
jgi:protein-tyrosine phosphatase